MQAGIRATFKHICAMLLLWVAAAAYGGPETTDMLSAPDTRWSTQDPELWDLREGTISGKTRIFDGAKTDPQASTFLVSRKVFSGDVAVDMDVSFSRGRYLGVYIDYGQVSESGIWMATGHALPEDAPDNEIERAYIKTVENGFWIVRANGELAFDQEEIVSLRFAHSGDEYRIYRDGHLVATYRKVGGYPAGQLQLRLTNSAATIHRLEVRSDEID